MTTPTPEQTDAPDEKSVVARLRDACNGRPSTLIPWPHGVLHDAAARLEELEAALAKLDAGTHVLAPNWAHIDTVPCGEPVWLTYEDGFIVWGFWYDEDKADWLRIHRREPFHDDEPPLYPIAWMPEIYVPDAMIKPAQDGE